MTRTLELPAVIASESDFSMCDRVTLLFEYRFSKEAEWTPIDYTINGTIVGGLQACERPDDVFEPHILPDVAIPEGDQYASGHPFKLNESPYPRILTDGTVIELRYLAVHSDVLNDTDKRFVEAMI